MKVKFITCIYSDLYGTEFGGRPGRHGHYRWSLLSLLKMTDADFTCYTSEREIDSLKSFFYEKHNIPTEKLEFKLFDINNTKHSEKLNLIKDVEGIKKGDRCLEIQYLKFEWFDFEDGSYDYYYWIDSGLSHVGLFPNRYLTSNELEQRYYECSLFNNEFLKKLISFTDDKFFMIGKDNDRNYWSGTVNPKWYTTYDRSIHIIGGLFGGKKEIWRKIVDLFDDYLSRIMDEDKQHPYEELIMSLMSVNHDELFNRKYFDTWWSEDSGMKGLPENYYEINKSFYKIFEELN
jgi:hypothetical protein